MTADARGKGGDHHLKLRHRLAKKLLMCEQAADSEGSREHLINCLLEVVASDTK
jgi:hypothetical protein